MYASLNGSKSNVSLDNQNFNSNVNYSNNYNYNNAFSHQFGTNFMSQSYFSNHKIEPRLPYPNYLNYTSTNTTSTCSSTKDEFSTSPYPNSNINKKNYFRKNSYQSSNSTTAGSHISGASNILTLAPNVITNSCPSRKSLPSDNSLLNTVAALLPKSNYSKKNIYNLKNNYNKFNYSPNINNNENTEILTIKILHEGEEKVLSLNRFDDLQTMAKNFCEKNKIPEICIKPISLKISQALDHIYKVYNSNLGKFDEDYLNSLNVLFKNYKKNSGNFNKDHASQIKQEIDQETNLDLTSISSFTLNEDYDEEDYHNFLSINKSF
jgi:hypothetical protein